MILLVGSPADLPLQAVAGALRSAGTAPALLDPAEPGAHLVRPWEPGREAVLRAGEAEIDLASVTAAYLRPTERTRRIPEVQAALAAVMAWADVTPAVIVNPPAAMTLNASKPLQIRRIAEHGLLTPETLVTTTPAEAISFRDRCGEVVYKSASAHRSVVRRLGRGRDGALSAVSACPTQFQAYVPGHDVRAHVVGDEIHALAIHAEGDDYRHAGAASPVVAEPTALPGALERQILAMVKAMRLLLAGVDLRRAPDGRFYCLEVNPSPGFTFYERIGGPPLAPAVAALMTGGSGRG